MAGQILGAWLELQGLALVGAAAAVAWFAREGRSEHCKIALAAAGEGREALLRETCHASDAGWARLMRFGLRQGPGTRRGLEENYRVAPVPVASRGLARCYRRERWRLRAALLAGLGCVEVSLAVTALMLSTPGFRNHGLVSGGLALALGAGVLVEAVRATRALRRTFDALPPLLLELGSPSAARLPMESGVLAWFEHRTGWAGLLKPLPLLGMLVYFCVHLARPVEAERTGSLWLTFLVFAALLLAPGALLSQTRVALDAARQELVVIRSLFSVVYQRMVFPLEIVRWFSVVPGDGSPMPVPTLAVDLGLGPSRVVAHEDAGRVAMELNQLLRFFRQRA